MAGGKVEDPEAEDEDRGQDRSRRRENPPDVLLHMPLSPELAEQIEQAAGAVGDHSTPDNLLTQTLMRSTGSKFVQQADIDSVARRLSMGGDEGSDDEGTDGDSGDHNGGDDGSGSGGGSGEGGSDDNGGGSGASDTGGCGIGMDNNTGSTQTTGPRRSPRCLEKTKAADPKNVETATRELYDAALLGKGVSDLREWAEKMQRPEVFRALDRADGDKDSVIERAGALSSEVFRIEQADNQAAALNLDANTPSSTIRRELHAALLRIHYDKLQDKHPHLGGQSKKRVEEAATRLLTLPEGPSRPSDHRRAPPNYGGGSGFPGGTPVSDARRWAEERISKLPKPDELFDIGDIGELALNVVRRFTLPNLFVGAAAEGRNLLIAGVGGTGKTELAHTVVCNVATALNGNLRYFTVGRDDLDNVLHKTCSRIKALFELAAEQSPAIIFYDECDMIFRKDMKMGGAIKKYWQKDFGESGAFVIGTTNHAEKIDEAIRSRFGKTLQMSLPSNEARRKIMLRALCKNTHNLSDIDWDCLLRPSGAGWYNGNPQNPLYPSGGKLLVGHFVPASPASTLRRRRSRSRPAPPSAAGARRARARASTPPAAATAAAIRTRSRTRTARRGPSGSARAPSRWRGCRARRGWSRRAPRTAARAAVRPAARATRAAVAAAAAAPPRAERRAAGASGCRRDLPAGARCLPPLRRPAPRAATPTARAPPQRVRP